VKERGILFSAPMVRALLAGTKTQTRRAIKLREFQPSKTRGYDFTFRDRRALWQDFTRARLLESCPYGVVGDRLWVRETWCLAHPECTQDFDAAEGRPRGPERYRGTDESWFAYYAATDPDVVSSEDHSRSPWKPSIHMPRWASRILLEITGVRAQRLHDIDEDDARAEGAPKQFVIDAASFVAGKLVDFEKISTHRHGFAALWREINGDDSWKSNPWVWAITFKRVEER
jgi:hypothetical protein